MKVVSPFEGRMLEALAFVLGRIPASQVLPVLRQGSQAPARFSADALALVRDMLSRGVVLTLARGGGWPRRTHLRGGQAVSGRLWERTRPGELGLTFTGASLDWLAWLTAAPAVAKGAARAPDSRAWRPSVPTEALGDQLLLLLSYRALRPLGLHRELGLDVHPRFVGQALCRLAFPEDFAGSPLRAASLEPWLAGPGAAVLEGLQDYLRDRWLEMEWGKNAISDPEVLERLGQRQGAVLAAFGKAVSGAERLDLAAFLLEALARLLPPGATAGAWLGTLNEALGRSLARRLAVRHSALAVPRYLGELKRWERAARATGYFDEGYAAAQLWLEMWERHGGDALVARAQAILKSVDPLHAAGGPS